MHNPCPTNCRCHTGLFAVCDTVGGCETAGCAPTWDDQYCRSGDRCPGFNHVDKHPAHASVRDPLCNGCLTATEQAVRTLLYDWVDLEQLQAPTLSQALNMQPSGKAAPPMPLNGQAEALQAEIVHVLTTWETEVRAATGLPDTPHVRRGGPNVQRAVQILAPRIRQLAAIPATAVYPTGPRDNPTDLTGWQAAHHLQALHQRARGMLGRTHRTRQLPGTCPTCHADLHQDDPRTPEDPTPVYCAQHCGWQTTRDDYEQWMTGFLLNPKRRIGAAA